MSLPLFCNLNCHFVSNVYAVLDTRSVLYYYLAQIEKVFLFFFIVFVVLWYSLRSQSEFFHSIPCRSGFVLYLHDGVRYELRFCNRTVWGRIARWLHIVSITQILLFTSMWCNWSIPFTAAHHTPHENAKCQAILGWLHKKKKQPKNRRKYCVKHKINYTHIEQNVIYCFYRNRTKRMVKLTTANIIRRLKCWDLCYYLIM